MIDDNSREFIRRHIGPSEEDIEKMLKVVGANSLDDLIKYALIKYKSAILHF